MTVPPSSGIPGIPGGTGWSSPQPSDSPVFVSPAPAPSMAANEQFELAGWGARLGAYGIDQVLRLVLAFAIAIGAFMLLADDPFSVPGYWDESEFPAPGTSYGDYNLIWLVLSGLAVYVVSAAFYAPVFMRLWRGATPGKRIVGIRVIHETGRDLTLGQTILREPLVKGVLINGIGGTLFLIPLVSYLWPLWDRECRAGHDFICKTRVVRSR